MAMTGAETIVTVRQRQSATLLAFSTGKDAIAAWLAIRDHFDEVHPYYLYLIPGLEFVEESLDYYERFFGVRIARLPHPSLHRWLNNLTFQPPERCAVIEQAALPGFDYMDIRQAMIEDYDLQEGTLVADGVPVTFWPGTQWSGGIVPALTASGRDRIGFYTSNGGSTWTLTPVALNVGCPTWRGRLPTRCMRRCRDRRRFFNHALRRLLARVGVFVG